MHTWRFTRLAIDHVISQDTHVSSCCSYPEQEANALDRQATPDHDTPTAKLGGQNLLLGEKASAY